MTVKTKNPGTADDSGQEYDPYAGAQGHDQASGDSSVPQGIDPGSVPDYDPYAGAQGQNQATDDRSDPRAGSMAAPVHSPYDDPGNADSSPKSGLRNAEENPDGEKSKKTGSESSASQDNSDSEASPGWLKDSEDNPEEAGFAKGFDEPEQEAQNKKKRSRGFALLTGYVQGRHKRIFLAGSAVSAIVSLMVALFTFIPFKIEHIIQNIQDHFSAGPKNALRLASKVIFNEYIKEYVIPAYGSCGTTIDRNCRVSIPLSTNPAKALYHNFANDRMEQKLAGKPYYIEFSKNRLSGHWHIKSTKTGQDGIDIGRNGEHLLRVLDNPDNAEIVDAFMKETGTLNAYQRYKLGSYLSRKYGEKRCIFACTLRKKVTEPIDEVKDKYTMAAKLVLTQRVLKPMSETKALAVTCMLENCGPQNYSSTGTDPPSSQYEQDLTEALRQSAQASGSGNGLDYDKSKAEYDDIAKNGLGQHLIESSIKGVVGKVAGEETADKTAKAASKAIPIIGWIHLGAQTTEMVKNADPVLDAIGYVTAAGAAYNFYQSYLTYKDEVHTGNVNAEEMGSMTNSLGPGIEDPDDPLVGGTASAEESPLYQAIISNKSSLQGEASVGSKNYKCSNNDPLLAGSLICPEEAMTASSDVLERVGKDLEKVCLTSNATTLANLAGASIPCPLNLTRASSIWMGSFGAIINAGESALGYIASGAFKAIGTAFNAYCDAPSLGPIKLFPVPMPNAATDTLCGAVSAAEEVATGIMGALILKVIPNPWGTNMGGGRATQMLFAGGAVEGKESSQKLGLGRTTNEEAAALIDEEKAIERREFEQQPFMARMFNIHDDMSFASMLAMQAPLNYKVAAQNSVAGILLNPFASLGNGFGSILASGRAHAAPTNPDAVDPYGIGVAKFDEDKLPSSPEKYLDNTDCDKSIEEWHKQAAEGDPHPNTGTPVYRDSNACQLLRTSIGSMGAKYDTNMLDPEDMEEMSGTAAGAPADSGSEPAGDIDVAKLFEDSSDISCAEGTKDLGVHTGYHDSKGVKIRLCAVEGMKSTSEDSTPGNEHYVDGANGNVMVNSRISKNFVRMVNAAKDDGVPMSANSSFRSMKHQEQLCNGNSACRSGNYSTVAKPGTSNHQMGIAIDFAMANQSKYSLSTGNCVHKNGVCTAPGDKVWEWLKKNAGKYGFKQYKAEFWHWSPNGS